MTMHHDELLTRISGGLIVSCQAPDGHAMRDTNTIVRLARAAANGGASAIRCGGVGGVADVAAVTDAVELPIIGLTKEGPDDVFITPTVASVRALVEAGATIVALDATLRPRPDGEAVADRIAAVHELGGFAMADVSTAEEGVAAAAEGADFIATTLSGYTEYTRDIVDADLALVSRLHAALPAIPLVAEGRYHTPDLAAAALREGATAVVAGTAITDPTWITQSFEQALRTTRR